MHPGGLVALAWTAVVLAALCVLATAFMYAKVCRLVEPHRRFLAAIGQMEFPDDLTRYLEILGSVHRRVEASEKRMEQIVETLKSAFSNIGLVRFDAFEHMGGRMSFSLALLDHRGDGFVLTGLHGRDSFDAYCSSVQGGRTAHQPMPEEAEAIAQAIGGAGSR